MSDVFVSYARSDEAHANCAADTLRSAGYRVWRDDELPAHRAYADVIEERLKVAKAVVLVWSVDAAKSQWVRAEADATRSGRTRGFITVGTFIGLWLASSVAQAGERKSADSKQHHAASASAEAVRTAALALTADDVIPTGNDWIALPSIRASDGALLNFNVTAKYFASIVNSLWERLLPLRHSRSKADTSGLTAELELL